MKLLLILLVFPLSAALASDFVPVCPATIDVEQKLINVPDGWSGSAEGGNNAKNKLENIQFSENDPINQAVLVPDSEKKSGGHIAATWIFRPLSEHGYWIFCEYSRTNLVITKRIPDDIQSCTVAYDTSPSGLRVRGVKCK